MLDEYDIAMMSPVPYPYAILRETLVPINIEPAVIDYFKEQASETGLSYKNLICFYLVDFVKEKKKFRILEAYDIDKLNPRKNQSVRERKTLVTITTPYKVKDYFKEQASETGIPYKTLLNACLLDCVNKKKKFKVYSLECENEKKKIVMVWESDECDDEDIVTIVAKPVTNKDELIGENK